MSARLCRLAALTVACLALIAVPAGAATITNGDFSAGLDGWTSSTSIGSESWATYSDNNNLPHSTNMASAHVPAPFGTSAVADPTDPMATILFQDIALETGMSHKLSLSYFVYNAWPEWITPSPLTFESSGDANQQGGIEVIKGTASPNSTDAGDVLATVWRSAPGQPLEFGWTNATVDLSAYAGQTVRLRAFDVNNQNVLIVGLDNVAIASADNVAPTLSGISTKQATYTEGAKNAGFSRGFTASEAGTLTATFSKLTQGRKSGGKCVKKTSKNKSAKKCNYWSDLKSTLTQPVVSGANTFKFNGKLSGKKLKAGKYKVTLTVKDATGNAATPVTIKFTVKAKKKK